MESKINDKDYEEISSTAIVTSYPRTFTDIPYEKKFTLGLVLTAIKK